jgi:hypothetical protein
MYCSLKILFIKFYPSLTGSDCSSIRLHLGDIVVFFDALGEIESWLGSLIYLNSEVIPGLKLHQNT